MPTKYATIPEFLAALDPAHREQVELIRSIITSAHPDLTEHIKWNAPSYVQDGEDRLTFNLQNKDNQVKLVLHMGATRTEDKKAQPVMADPAGFISWQSDIRGIISFTDLADIQRQRTELADAVKRWLALS